MLPNAAPRLVKQPVEVGGWSYEPGVCLVAERLPASTTTRTIYPDPYAFRPERFLDEQPGTYTWIPFGGGRRRCLGASFAMLEMKIVLRAVLAQERARARRRPATEGARRRGITLSPRGRQPRGAARPPRVADPGRRLTARAVSASAVLRVLVVEPAAGLPFAPLVAVRRYPAGVLQHPGEVEQVPRHERGVPVGEVVVRPA